VHKSITYLIWLFRNFFEQRLNVFSLAEHYFHGNRSGHAAYWCMPFNCADIAAVCTKDRYLRKDAFSV
ncbi:hypothetical protein, partial [Pseudomonas amygdali]|uniref:hypothetical protein n=1 Tax=Pseudomonas amygdali TaxID=47877 RepID=UPI001E3120E1